MELCSVGKSPPNRVSAKSHSHSSWEFAYNVCGSGTTTVGDKTYQFEPGTILLCPPQISHDKVSDHGFEDIFFHFNGFECPRQVYLLKDTTALKAQRPDTVPLH